MLEQEAWGQLTKEQFEKFLRLFSGRFGKPSRHKRLSFSFWNHEMNEVDTRIRITDGKAEIMQKVGKWDNTTQWDRTEKHVELPPESEQIFSIYEILRRLLPPAEPCHLMQYDNYVFEQPDFEIKLSHQYGKSHKYNFEVETLNNQRNLKTVLKNLSLSKLVTITDVEFWDQWNQELNLSDKNLNDEQIMQLIKAYL